METLDASTNQGDLTFKQKLRDLEHQINATKLEIKSLEADETNMLQLYKISQEEQVNAAKLYELEVINLTQLKKFQKEAIEAIEAKNNWQSVKRKITYHNDIISQIKKRAEALKLDQDGLLKRNNESIAKLKIRKEFVESQLNEYKEFSAGGNKNVTVYSPINGRILENHIKPGDSLAPKDPIVTLYRPNFMELRAYVEERFMDRIKVGSTAVVSMFNNSFESKITHIRKMIVQSPKELRGRKLVPEDRYYFSIELDTANMPDGLFPGKTGKVIFKE